MKFAVAMANLFENVNEVKIVEAENPVDAITLALEGTLDIDFQLPKTVEGLKEYYFSGDMVVSSPLEID